MANRKVYYMMIGDKSFPIIYSNKKRLLEDLRKWVDRLDLEIMNVIERWDWKWDRSLQLLHAQCTTDPKPQNERVDITLMWDELDGSKNYNKMFHHLLEGFDPKEPPEELDDDQWFDWVNEKARQRERLIERWEALEQKQKRYREFDKRFDNVKS
jgi:hypothetical protein